VSAASGKRVALNRLTLTVRSVDALKPAERSWIAWDDRLTGFGVRVQPSGLKSFIVNYRAGDGGRKAPNRRVVLGRHGEIRWRRRGGRRGRCSRPRPAARTRPAGTTSNAACPSWSAPSRTSCASIPGGPPAPRSSTARSSPVTSPAGASGPSTRSRGATWKPCSSG